VEWTPHTPVADFPTQPDHCITPDHCISEDLTPAFPFKSFESPRPVQLKSRENNQKVQRTDNSNLQVHESSSELPTHKVVTPHPAPDDSSYVLSDVAAMDRLFEENRQRLLAFDGDFAYAEAAPSNGPFLDPETFAAPPVISRTGVAYPLIEAYQVEIIKKKDKIICILGKKIQAQQELIVEAQEKATVSPEALGAAQQKNIVEPVDVEMQVNQEDVVDTSTVVGIGNGEANPLQSFDPFEKYCKKHGSGKVLKLLKPFIGSDPKAIIGGHYGVGDTVLHTMADLDQELNVNNACVSWNVEKIFYDLDDETFARIHQKLQCKGTKISILNKTIMWDVVPNATMFTAQSHTHPLISFLHLLEQSKGFSREEYFRLYNNVWLEIFEKYPMVKTFLTLGVPATNFFKQQFGTNIQDMQEYPTILQCGHPQMLLDTTKFVVQIGYENIYDTSLAILLSAVTELDIKNVNVWRYRVSQLGRGTHRGKEAQGQETRGEGKKRSKEDAALIKEIYSPNVKVCSVVGCETPVKKRKRCSVADCGK